jgi:16S rRNA (adenine1518-N6/adenine1519-N6)-dimethyltransferase
MVQKEVANRLIAETKTKDYGILTIFTGLYSNVDKLFDVNRENFYPVPNVDSSVVCLDFNVLSDDKVNYQLLKKIVRTGFNFRRKMLRNSLSKLFSNRILAEISTVSLERRPEELTIEEFKILTTEISSKME